MKIQFIIATDTIVGSLFSKDPDLTVGRMRLRIQWPRLKDTIELGVPWIRAATFVKRSHIWEFTGARRRTILRCAHYEAQSATDDSRLGHNSSSPETAAVTQNMFLAKPLSFQYMMNLLHSGFPKEKIVIDWWNTNWQYKALSFHKIVTNLFTVYAAAAFFIEILRSHFPRLWSDSPTTQFPEQGSRPKNFISKLYFSQPKPM